MTAPRGSRMAAAPAADGQENGSWKCEPEHCDWDMAPLIRQDDPAARKYAVAAGGTLIRRYVLALPPQPDAELLATLA